MNTEICETYHLSYALLKTLNFVRQDKWVGGDCVGINGGGGGGGSQWRWFNEYKILK